MRREGTHCIRCWRHTSPLLHLPGADLPSGGLACGPLRALNCSVRRLSRSDFASVTSVISYEAAGQPGNRARAQGALRSMEAPVHPVAEPELERPTKFGNVRLSEFEVDMLPRNPEPIVNSISGPPGMEHWGPGNHCMHCHSAACMALPPATISVARRLSAIFTASSAFTMVHQCSRSLSRPSACNAAPTACSTSQECAHAAAR